MSSSTLARRLHADPDARRREIVTPEGVPLVFTLSRAGDRVSGFLIDMLIQLAVLALIGLTLGIAAGGGGGWLGAFLMLAFFLVRTSYFIWFELRWQGRTPGKRIMGERVIDAHGGVLPAEAVVVRNLTREAETFLPLTLFANPDLLVSSGPMWVRVLSTLWVAIFLFLPFLNRDRRRLGDLLAGTLVVRDPRTRLRAELGRARKATGEATRELHFTRAQLEQYGIYELQVLEELLRDPGSDSTALATVAERIQLKIAFDSPTAELDPKTFLDAFYRAQRSRLEHDLVLGKARERKRVGKLS